MQLFVHIATQTICKIFADKSAYDQNEHKRII